MASAASRGRGRGRGLLVHRLTAPTRPGPDGDSGDDAAPLSSTANGADDVSLKEIEEYIQSLSLHIEEENLDKINDLINQAAKSESDLRHVAQTVYNKSLHDQEFGKCAACICDRLANVEVQGIKFRDAVLKLVQEDFRVKEDTRVNDNKRFLGFFTFLVQIFCNMRLATGDPFKPLVGPICDCFELILNDENSTEDEYEVLSLQMQCAGKDLESQDPGRMSSVLENLRSRIIRDGLTARGRCTLLELLECSARSWKSLPNELTRFYCDKMVEIFATSIE